MMLNVDEDTGTLFTLSISHRKGGEFTCIASNALGLDSASSFVTVLGENASHKFITITVDGVFRYYYCWCKLMPLSRKILATAVAYKCSCLMDLVHAVYGSSVTSPEGKCM